MRRVSRPQAADVAAARAAIARTLAPTPLDVTAGPGLALKLESLQPTGSFKVRGALNALTSLDPGLPVVTASAGNHGLGVAYAAARLGREATVVVPETASPAKTEALRKYPVTLVRTGRSYEEAEAHAIALGGYYLSPYNDPLVIAGQGTIGCELDEQTGGELTVVCAVGGGGLAAGLGLWASRRPGTRIVGVEAAASTAVSAAVRAGHTVPVEVDTTLADGLAGNLEPGSVTVDLIRDHVGALVTVTEDEITSAIRYLATAHGVIAEGAGAAATAAVLAGKVPAASQVVAVVSGRNIAAPTLAAILGLSGPTSQDRVRIMRLATIRTSDGTTAARLEDQTLIPLAAQSVSELFETGQLESARDRVGASPVPVPEADFAPVVPRPGKIICVGLNYRMHIAETGRETPEYPTIFTKYPDALLGPGDDLVLPSVSDRVDWEVELGVIVGNAIHRASVDEAQAAIAGYTVTNDISMRDWQRRTLQWWAGKNFERSTPVGPYLVTPDEADPDDLEVRCTVDDDVVQQSRTSDLLFSPARILAYASQIVTLRPGDLILTGTPGGVGDARTPPVYLKPGNVMRTYIEGLGECVNTCVAEK
jgi:threonine dehydratase